jgi:hypothetical protein
LVQELKPHVQLEERGRGNEEQVVVGGNVVRFDGCHEGWHEVGWVKGLKVHNCQVEMLVLKRRIYDDSGWVKGMGSKKITS